jgi:hypothetical protein
LKAGPEEMDANMVILEECSHKMEAMAWVWRQIQRKWRLQWSRRNSVNVWLCSIADGQSSRPRRVLGPGRSCLQPGNDRYAALFLHCKRETLARDQGRKSQQEELCTSRHSGRQDRSAWSAKMA